MQLGVSKPTSPLRSRLSAAAGALLALGSPAVSHGDAANPTWHVDASTLFYGERSRTRIVEPVVRVTRLFPDGQSISAKLAFDTMTGATPSGAMPSGRVQTTTTASGHVVTSTVGDIPLLPFRDTRAALDVEWQKPILGTLRSTIGGHVSREKDYQSLGANAKLSVDLMQRLTTVTVGAGTNRDSVFPIGGTPVGLSDGTILDTGSQAKRVTDGMVGLTRVITRRWIAAVNVSRTLESGYLTEPYKVVSLLDRVNGLPSGELKENRPSTRNRTDVLGSSVYHFTDDVLYSSYRYYWDDWGVRSHTIDMKYRHELEDNRYVQPHVRYYAQTRADFFTFGLKKGAPLPAYATSDYRLGPLRTVTLGLTYGFRTDYVPGEFSIRGEYMRQYGDGYPKDAIGTMSTMDLFPPVGIATLVLAYTVDF